MKKSSIYILLILLATACSSTTKDSSFGKIIKAKRLSVLMFIAPDCPMCKTLATPFSQLAQDYPQIQFVAVHSGKHYDPMEINMFATETKLTTPIYRDYQYQVARQYGASVTPEFFLIDSTQTVIYKGMMDDRLLDLGSYKQQWNKHFLKDAIDATLAGKKPEIIKTEAAGCVLEY